MLTYADLNVIIVKVDASRTLEDILMSNEKVARFNKQHYVVGLKETLKALNRKIKLHLDYCSRR